MSEHVEGTMMEKIKLTSELIFENLHEEKEFDLDQIKKQVDWRSPLFDWAFGYLIGVGDIEVTEHDGALHVRRKLIHYPFYANTQD